VILEKENLKILDSLQQNLKRQICFENKLKKLETVAGCDVSYQGKKAKVGVCVLNDKGEILEEISIVRKAPFPYLSGYLMLREAPLILEALFKIKTQINCIFVDGNGILHPHNLGLATFLGIILKKPTIGCAKTLLLGRYSPLDKKRGNFSYIKHKGKILGIALCTKDNAKEIYVSCGWGVSLRKAKEAVLKFSRYRIPEPIRKAHKLSKFYDNFKG
jgi:deoxyribonuclease V